MNQTKMNDLSPCAVERMSKLHEPKLFGHPKVLPLWSYDYRK